MNPSIPKTYCPKRDMRRARIEKPRARGMASLHVDSRADGAATRTHMKGVCERFCRLYVEMNSETVLGQQTLAMRTL